MRFYSVFGHSDDRYDYRASRNVSRLLCNTNCIFHKGARVLRSKACLSKPKCHPMHLEGSTVAADRQKRDKNAKKMRGKNWKIVTNRRKLKLVHQFFVLKMLLGNHP